NLVNMNAAFLDRPDITKILKDNHLYFPLEKIQGIRLLMDNGIYQGRKETTGQLFAANSDHFPINCIVIGDDPMEKYGFGDFLVNVQTFDKNKTRLTISKRMPEIISYLQQ
ncbi:hypothetical protein ACFL5G_04660, partial [Candidatus Margulisiibacteriota bacterium]